MPETTELEKQNFVMFTAGEQKFLIELGVVERVIPSLEITAIPSAPKIVPGVINIAGAVLPVISIRKRFCLPEREMGVSDQLLIARVPRRVALLVDEVNGVNEITANEIVSDLGIFPKIGPLKGIVILKGGVVLIQDVEKVLTREEEFNLKETLAQLQNGT